MADTLPRLLETARFDLALRSVESARAATGDADAAARPSLLCDEAEVHLLLGHGEAALRCADQAMALAGPQKQREVLARACLIRAQVALETHSTSQARAHAAAAAAHLDADSPPALHGRLLVLEARLDIQEGALPAAAEALDEAEKLLPPGDLFLARCELLTAQGRWSDAEALLARGLKEAEARGRRETMWQAAWRLARVARETGRLSEARRWHERATRVITETAARLPPELAPRYLAHPARAGVLEGGVDTQGGSYDAELLHRIVDIIAAMSSETVPSRLLARILDTMIEVCNARRGFLLLLRPDGPAIELARHRDARDLAAEERSYPSAVVAEAAREGKPLLITNAPADARFGMRPAQREAELSSVLCLPLALRGRVIGVVYLDNELVTHAFHEREMNAARILANQAAVVLEHAALLSAGARDAASGLISHTHFAELLRHEVNRAHRASGACGVAIAAIDQLQTIRERHGEGVAGQLLAEAGRFLASCVRNYDVVAESPPGVPGHVFQILLPDEDRDGLGAIGGRVLQAFRGRIFTIGQDRISVTVTIGAAVYPVDATEPADLVASARGAFTRAVEAGRDRMLFASEARGPVREARPAAPKRNYPGIVGRSRGLQELLVTLDRVVQVDYPVVIEGETGVGKELIANAIHTSGDRRDAPFVALNCAALSETLLEVELFGHVKGAFTGAAAPRPGLFEEAKHGTLFLDEVEEMSDAMQKKLLRVLEDKKVRRVGSTSEATVDVRIVAATNRDMKGLVASGAFREDLYYRLATFILRVPPLRERADDIPLLIDHILEAVARETGRPRKSMSSGALSLLSKYRWPGNVRELQNEVRRLALTAGDTILEADLPPHLRDDAVARMLPLSGTYRERLESFEKRLLVEALVENKWNLSATARVLEIDRNTLKVRMQRYGVDRPDDAPPAE